MRTGVALLLVLGSCAGGDVAAPVAVNESRSPSRHSHQALKLREGWCLACGVGFAGGKEYARACCYDAAVIDGSPCPSHATVDDLLAHCRRLDAEGRNETALETATLAVERDGRRAETWYFRGTFRRARRDYDGALADFDRALEIDPKHAPSLNGRGLIRYEQGDLAAAEAEYDRAIEADPMLAVPLRNRALLHLQRLDHDLAAADYQRAFERGSKDPDFLANFAVSRLERGDARGAIAVLKKRSPPSPWTYSTRIVMGRALEQLGESGADEFAAAAALQPLDPEAEAWRGWSRWLRGEQEAAVGHLRKALALRRRGLGIESFLLFLVRRGEGHEREARSELAARLKESGETRLWPIQIASFLMGRLDGEQLLSSAALPEEPRVSRNQLADAHFYVACLKLPSWPNDADRHWSEAVGAGCPARYTAVAARQRLLRWKAAAVSAAKAGLLLTEEDRDAALPRLTKAIAFEPADADLFRSRGAVWLRKRDHGRAFADFTASIELSEYAGSLAWRAQARIGLRDLPGAEADLTRALEVGSRDPEELCSVLKSRAAVRRARGNAAGADEDERKAGSTP